MKVKFSITFDCEYEIDPYNEEWMEEDDDGKLSFNEDFALELLRSYIEDSPEQYAGDYCENYHFSELTVTSR